MYFMAMDIETTGLDIYKDQPIQLAHSVHDEAGTLVDEGVMYINPEKPLPEIITEITGITDDILKEKGLSNISAISRWQRFVWDYQPCTLIGYNLINFDFPMIQNWINNFCNDRFKFPPIHQIYDVMHMVSDHFKTRKWIKLADAGKRLGIKFDADSLHDALTDIKLTKQVYDIIIKVDEMNQG